MNRVATLSGEELQQAVRGLQVQFLERNFLATLPLGMAGLILTCGLFWPVCGEALLLWVAATAPVALMRFAYAYRAASTPPLPRAANDVWRHPILDLLLWLGYFVPPLLFEFYYGEAVSLYMLVIVSSVMWVGAFAYAAIFWISAAFILADILCWFLVSAILGSTVFDFRSFGLLVFMAFVALLIVRKLSIVLEKSLQQKFRFEQQAHELGQRVETVSHLLHEQQDETRDWLWKVDATNRCVEVSARFADAFKRLLDEVEQLSIIDVLKADDVPGNCEACELLGNYLKKKQSFRNLIVPGFVEGDPRWWSISGHPVIDECAQGSVFRGVMSDVTAEYLAKQEMQELARRDLLTKLPNRHTFFKRLEAMLARKNVANVTAISIDLDGFKFANDKYGNPVGDAILKVVADRIREVVGSLGFVARVGGDEFLIKTLLTERTSVSLLCDELLNALSSPYQVEDVLVRISASIGIATSLEQGEAADTLLRNADAALHRAKRAGRGQYRFYDQEIDKLTKQRAAMLQDLRDALVLDEFVLFYQAFVSSISGEVTGYEALIRWCNSVRGMVSPAEFIPLAEESGLIVAIGEWVINRACRDAAAWGDDRRVSVNISAMQFQDEALPERIRNALAASGLAPKLLEIELTESALIDNIDEAVAMLNRIRDLGVTIALDDFGTGYSSLSYLRTLSFDRIKIDRSFVKDMSTDAGSRVIIRAVGDIAEGLGMTVVAEGVETREQAELLGQKGCQELQGFFFGRPVENAQRLISPKVDVRSPKSYKKNRDLISDSTHFPIAVGRDFRI